MEPVLSVSSFNFLFILDYGMMLDIKQIWAIFFEFKMGYKASETTCSINNTFGPRTTNECTVQRLFKKFCKGEENLEDDECSGRPLEVDDQLRAILKANPLTTTWEVASEFDVDHSVIIWHLKQIGKVKKLDK